MTVKKIAEVFGIKSYEINMLLTELGYQKKARGGYILLKDKLGEQKLFRKKGENSVPYIEWKDFILKNNALKKAVKEFKAPTEVPSNKFSQKKEEEHVPFDRTKFKAEFRTIDGHFVRSKAEVIIDNWLYMNGIVHAYERRVPIEEELYSDFYLPKERIYIEFWGLENDAKYIQRKEEKIDLYKKYGIKLLELNEEDVKNIDDTLPLKLLKLGVSTI